jgi:hypothetical protein
VNGLSVISDSFNTAPDSLRSSAALARFASAFNPKQPMIKTQNSLYIYKAPHYVVCQSGRLHAEEVVGRLFSVE